MSEPCARTICVIDDDPFTRLTISAALNYAGFKTTQASNGEAGLNLIERVGASIAIVDIVMPIKDGFDTIVEAKARFPALKILAISGGGMTGARGELLAMARAIGADGCLAKPIRSADLLSAVGAIHSPKP